MKKIGIKSLPQYIAETNDKIVYCKAYGRCTRIYFENNKQIIISENIKAIENLVKGDKYFRSHKSNLVNLRYIIGVNYNKRTIYLENGYVAEVSVRRVTELKFLRANGERVAGFDFKRKKIRRTNCTSVTF